MQFIGPQDGCPEENLQHNQATRIFGTHNGKTGRVRALILKARQPGCSTYVEGRFYWKVTHREGVRAFILTHKQDATDNLFTMAQRFYEHCPPEVRPHQGRANAKEMVFDALDSGFKVGTAGTKGVGRSDTIQYLHGSEVAYWENADEHMAGVLQAVPDKNGTEIILESTANGRGGLFYSMCKAAEKGDSEYVLIFIPWFVHDEYRRDVPDDWTPPEAIAEYASLYDLDPEQTYWLFAKNRDLAQSIGADHDEICWKFRQEYPANAEEAFQTGGDQTFISSEAVMRARRNTVDVDAVTPIILGVDVARGGKDRTRIIDRQGRKLGGRINETIDSDDTMHVAGIVARYIKDTGPAKVNIDITGLGAGVYDRLREMGHGTVVEGINFGSRAYAEEIYANKRAEMWAELRDWFAEPAGVDIPDDDSLHTEMCAPVWGSGATRHDSNSRLLIEPKEHIISRLGVSPDGADAAALTFAVPVQSFAGMTIEYPSRPDLI